MVSVSASFATCSCFHSSLLSKHHSPLLLFVCVEIVFLYLLDHEIVPCIIYAVERDFYLTHSLLDINILFLPLYLLHSLSLSDTHKHSLTHTLAHINVLSMNHFQEAEDGVFRMLSVSTRDH